MNRDAIRWQIFPRDVLPDVLFGGGDVRIASWSGFEPLDLRDGKVAVGFAGARSTTNYNPPCLLIPGGESMAETLSWLKVYAPETFPLSQFARIISIDEWARFPESNGYRSKQQREDIWASIVVGEVIAQGDTDAELSTIPLSRASGCFSMAMARAACVHASDGATHTCADRLRFVESDSRFARRAVSVEDLLPIWALVGARLGGTLSAQDAVDLVLDAALNYFPKPKTGDFARRFSGLQHYPGLKSDSIEERVLAFQKLAVEYGFSAQRNERNGLQSVVLAAAAFLVGRGTSHVFLLRRVGKPSSSAAAWFGLISALAGPPSWDPNWSRAAKGVERQIRSGFSWTDFSGSDLCWTEFRWLATSFDGGEVFATLPKMMPKAISIELIPGATCQFRLAADSASESERRVAIDKSVRERDLEVALAQFIGLASRVRNLVDDHRPPVQQSLGLEGTTDQHPRNVRIKKSKSSTGGK